MALTMRTPLRVNRQSAVVAKRPARISSVKTKALLETSVVIGGSTVAFLTLGRFVFLPYQRREAAFDDIGPKTTGTTFFDDLQKPSSFTTTTKDPAGFTIIDVLGWGALGHAFGYFILAASSLNAAGIAAFPR